MLRRLTWFVVGPVLRTPRGMLSPRGKAQTLIEYAQRHGLETLVETGTYKGDTVSACLGRFAQIYTIELDPTLHTRAQKLFAHEPSVTTIQGDSCEELLRLAPGLEGPVLFWLDAHYSEGVTAQGPHDPPLQFELEAILARGERDVILIDDARLLGQNPGWPSVDEVERIVNARAETVEVRDDIIRIALG